MTEPNDTTTPDEMKPEGSTTITAPPAEPPQPPTPQEEPTSDSGGFGRWLLETVLMVAVAFILAQGIKTYIVQPFVVPTGSMEPTILIGDRFLAEKVSYHFDDPEVGDVIVFDDPAGIHPQLVKRVIAVEGQEIDIRDGEVFIDGVKLDEPYLDGVRTDVGTEQMPLVVPEGYIWVMGDNRPNSGDSRFIGPQPLSGVKGRAFVIYWPISSMGGL